MLFYLALFVILGLVVFFVVFLLLIVVLPLDDYRNRPSVTGSTPTDPKMVRQGPTGREPARSGRWW